MCILPIEDNYFGLAYFRLFQFSLFTLTRRAIHVFRLGVCKNPAKKNDFLKRLFQTILLKSEWLLWGRGYEWVIKRLVTPFVSSWPLKFQNGYQYINDSFFISSRSITTSNEFPFLYKMGANMDKMTTIMCYWE